MPWETAVTFPLYFSFPFPPIEGSSQPPQLNRANMGSGGGEKEGHQAYYGIFQGVSCEPGPELGWALWFGGVMMTQITGWGRQI